MKLILINPPRENPQVADYPPLGLAYIEVAALQDGHEVRILDAASWSFERLAQEIQSENPGVVGITCWTIERGQAFRVARIAKEAVPNALIIMGGPHATSFPEHMFIKTPADYVVMGEGEETIRELLQVIEKGGDLSCVLGLAYRKGGEFFRNERRPLIKDLDTVPLVRHAQFDYGQYNGLHDNNRKAAAIMTSRGCPFRCAFCSSAVYWGRKYRSRSVQSVLSEIDHLYNDIGIRALLIFDDNLLIDRKRCIALCQALCDRKYDLVWAAEGSVKVDQEMLGWMKRAGCYRIDFGVESGSPTILKNINKPFGVNEARNAFRLCKEAGITPNAYLIFGSPGETAQTIDETVTLMREIQPDSGGGRPGIWILPDTDIYELGKKHGIINEETWLQSDDTLYYTVEHTREELVALERRFRVGMMRGRNNFRYAAEMAMRMLPSPVDSALRKQKLKVSLLLSR